MVVALLTLFRMGLFGAAHEWGAKKAPSLKSVIHPTLCSYTLPSEDLKIYKSHDTL